MKSKMQFPSHDFGDAGIADFPSGNAVGMECSQCQSYFYVLQSQRQGTPGTLELRRFPAESQMPNMQLGTLLFCYHISMLL